MNREALRRARFSERRKGNETYTPILTREHSSNPTYRAAWKRMQRQIQRQGSE